MSETIRVTGPNGRTVEFPTGTDTATINQVMSELHAQSQPAQPAPKSNNQQMMEGLGQGITDSGFLEGIPVVGKPLSRFMENRSPEAQGRMIAAPAMALNGATFGGLDEAVGLMGRVTGNDDWNGAIDTLKDASRDVYPVTSAVSEMAGATVTGGPVASRLGAGRNASTARNAATAAGGGAVYGSLETEGGAGERAVGAGQTAALSAVGGYIGDRVIRAGGAQLARLMRGRRFVQDGQLTEQAREVIRRGGVDPDELTPEDIAHITESVKGGFNPDEAARLNDAGNLPVPVQLTTGQVTRNSNDLRTELAARDGMLGNQAERIAKDAMDGQQRSIQQNADVFREQMTGRSRVDVNEGLVPAGRGLRENAEGLNAQAVAARELAQSGQATTPVDLLSGISGRVRSQMDEAGNIAGTDAREAVERNFLRQADAIIERVERGRLPINAIARLRADVSAASSGAQGSARSYLGQITKEIDAALDDIVERGLIDGDPESVKAWGESTALFRDYFKRYQGKQGAERLVARVVNGEVEPERISQLLFSSQTNAKGTTGGLALARRLRTEFGENSDEWNSIRGEALTRLFNESAEGQIGPRFSTALEKMLREDGAMMRVLFNPDEVHAMRRLSRGVRAINFEPSNRGNRSASGNTLNFLTRVIGGPSLDILKGMPIIKDVVESIADGRQARNVQRLVSGPN